MSTVSKNKNPQRIVYLLFCLSVLTVPVNIPFFNIVRLSDIFIITSLIVYFLCNPSIKYIYLMIFSIFFGTLMLSYFTSLLLNYSFRYTGLAFYYKYLLIFFIPWIVIEVVNNRKRLIGLVSKLYLIYL